MPVPPSFRACAIAPSPNHTTGRRCSFRRFLLAPRRRRSWPRRFWSRCRASAGRWRTGLARFGWADLRRRRRGRSRWRRGGLLAAVSRSDRGRPRGGRNARRLIGYYSRRWLNHSWCRCGCRPSRPTGRRNGSNLGRGLYRQRACSGRRSRSDAGRRQIARNDLVPEIGHSVPVGIGDQKCHLVRFQGAIPERQIVQAAEKRVADFARQVVDEACPDVNGTLAKTDAVEHTRGRIRLPRRLSINVETDNARIVNGTNVAPPAYPNTAGRLTGPGTRVGPIRRDATFEDRHAAWRQIQAVAQGRVCGRNTSTQDRLVG